MPGQPTFFGHGDNPRLFADNQGDRVGGLCDAQSRAMPRAQFPADAFSFAEGKETSCGHNLIAAYHDRSVVQRGVRLKDVLQQRAADAAVQCGSGFDDVFQADSLFKYDQRADSAAVIASSWP